MKQFRVGIVLCSLLVISSCGSADPPASCGSSSVSGAISSSLVQVASCSGTPATALPNYDRLSAQFLNEITSHPPDNLWGDVVWNTRYYLESLLTAYEATGNPKYIHAFLDTGQTVLNLVQDMTVVDVPDPGQPIPPNAGSQVKLKGWPTKLSSFGVPTMVPTQSGAVALYAQSLGPALYFEVTSLPNGALQLAWIGGNNVVLETDTVQTVGDLNTVASEPIFWDQSVSSGIGQSVGRIKPTGAGMPVPGIYPVFNLETTIWNVEQSGGILLPFVHFLVLAKQNPKLVSETTREQWTSQIKSIAANYESSFVPDGSGGLELHNPRWLPNGVADLDAPTDYLSTEATTRLFLYELTGDEDQLALAQGLISHQQRYNWSIGPQNWLLLQLWPDLIPWSNRSNAPSGSVWDSFSFDPSTAEFATDGGFFVALLHYLNVFSIKAPACVFSYIYNANSAAFHQYLSYNPTSDGPQPLLRNQYPTAQSKALDSISASQDPFAGAAYLVPEVADQSFVDAHWKWMQEYAQSPQGQPVGYFLRAWAMSEAAELNRCKYPPKAQ